jgi:diaminohydroxyphosphoribosylaminopyrimidine deaminase / 5-amino-6-(5-phosphoribosylamino)uracil reductase
MNDLLAMRHALRLAQRAYGSTSPNPSVGAVLLRNGRVLGRGWHHRAGEPHAEIEALRDAAHRGHSPRGATLVVTLEPCSTTGRTPPCTEAIIAAGIQRVVVAATDPNPRHAGRGFAVLRQAGVGVEHGLLEADATRLNEAFNHWIVRGTPFVTVKAAMTLDGKIATARGESKWITGEAARARAMHLRLGSDAILVGINTILADDPSLTVRAGPGAAAKPKTRRGAASLRVVDHLQVVKPIRRIVLDTRARTPPAARVVRDEFAAWTTVVVSADAPTRRVRALARQVKVLEAPARAGQVDVRWLLRRLGQEGITHVLVEGGGEVQASFLERRLAQRVVFFYAPMILGGAESRKAVAGVGFKGWGSLVRLREVEWRTAGPDLWLTARVD